ncbi:MAG TPA: hypothetical protein VMV24_00785 [Candidatus Dormibacteraeota bacterium]|nr:hypothetical protein [Candidatus Dormibacteraeota bacterium]
MNNQATKKDINEVIDTIKIFIDQVSSKFEAVEKRFDALDVKYDHLINTIDGFIGRIDRYETEMAARDNQFERLLSWAHKVSKKTGIPLENL